MFPEDALAEDKHPVHWVTSAVAVTAGIACDAATELPQDQVQGLFQGFFDQGGLFGCHGPTATPEKKKQKHGKGKCNRVVKEVCLSSHVPKIPICRA